MFNRVSASWTRQSRRILISVAAMVLMSSLAAFGFDVVRDGKATCVIVIPDNASVWAYDVMKAAQELQYHVKKASGATLSITKESSAPETFPNRFYLGDCSAAKKAGVATGGLSRNGFIIKTVENNLFIAGRDIPGTEWGTLMGIYNFLDQEMGVRWLWPGTLGEVIPQKLTISIKSCDKTVIPPLRSSRMHTVWATNGWASAEASNKFKEDDIQWMIRHGFSWDTKLRSQHSFGEYWERFGKSHPEFFNLLPDGTRRPDPFHVCGGAGSYVSMCQSEPEFWKQIIEDWKVRPEKHSTIWVGENDTCGSCCCQRCLGWDVPDGNLQIPWDQRLDYAKKDFDAGKGSWTANLGNLSDRYARFYKEVYDLAQQTDTNALVIGFAYANYSEPPLKAKLNNNIVICFVGQLMYPWTKAKIQKFTEAWTGWRNTGATLVLRPNFMLDGHCLPIFTARKFGKLFAFCHRNGMIGSEFDSNTGQYGSKGPDMYVLARMNQAMAKPVDEILDEYFQAFGPAQKYVRKYFALWERVSDAPATLEAYAKVNQGTDILFMESWNRFYLIANKIFTPEIVAQGWKLLDKALAAAEDNPEAKARVKFLRKGFKNAELTLAAQQAYASEDKVKLGKAIAELDSYRASIEGDNVANMAFLVGIESLTWDRAQMKLAKSPPGKPLPDTWKFIWDPELKGLNEKWYADDFDGSKWCAIGIDSPWEQQPIGKKWKAEHNGTDYNGIGWYRNTFSVKPDTSDKGGKVRLTFGAVDEACTIWVNGIKVLERPYPYQGNGDSWREPFEVDISTAVRFNRPNILAVRVEDNAGAGGIWRPVWIH